MKIRYTKNERFSFKTRLAFPFLMINEGGSGRGWMHVILRNIFTLVSHSSYTP